MKAEDGANQERERLPLVRSLARLLLAVAVPLAVVGGGLWYVVGIERIDATLEQQATAHHRLVDLVVAGAAEADTDGVGARVSDPLAIASRVATLIEPLLGEVTLTIVGADGVVAYGEATDGLTDLDRVALTGVPTGITSAAADGRQSSTYALPWAPDDAATVAVVRLALADDRAVAAVVDDLTDTRVLFAAAFAVLLVALVPTCWWSLGRLRKHLRRTRRLAVSDSLTGLANRSQFHDRLEEAVAAAHRSRSTVGLLMVDLDGFKAINDTGGHAAGDRLLKRVGAALEDATRRNELACRLGGDEFAVILPRINDRSELVNLAERLHEKLDISVEFSDGRALRVTASIGLAAFPDDATSADDLITVADVAMYNVKAARLASLPKVARTRSLVR